MARAFGVTVHPVDGMDHPVEQALPNIHTQGRLGGADRGQGDPLPAPIRNEPDRRERERHRLSHSPHPPASHTGLR